MSKISFGNIVKVNAPIETAHRIILMSKSRTRANANINKILYGNEDSKAFAYSFPNNPNESYIFTGEEGKTYWKSLCETWDKMSAVHNRYYKDEILENRNTKNAWKEHINNVRKLISSAKEIKELKTENIENSAINYLI